MKTIAKPVERFEDLRLLRGRGSYVDDQHAEGMLHAAILRSTVAHGRIRSISADKARALPGVHAVFTAEDVAKGAPVPTIPLRLAPLPELVPYEQPVIAQREVNYVGEPLALVVADTLAQAEDALDAIEVDIESLPPVVDCHAGQLAITYTATKGDALGAQAPYRRKERLAVQRHTAVCMEPRGLLATWDGARTKLTVSGAAKVPFSTRRMLAKNMDLPEDCIDMLEPDVGGGFGVRGEFYPEGFVIPFAARRLGRPVRWTEDGPGRFEADFFRERLIDMAAKDLGIDPVEFRRRNLPTPGEMPYALATITPPEKKEQLDSGDYAAALDRCVLEFDFEEKKKLQ